MIIDSHCHLSFDQLGNYTDETKEILKLAKGYNIGAVLDIATDLAMFKNTLDFAEKMASLSSKQLPYILCALGVHPLHIEQNPSFKAEDLAPFLTNKYLVAIGETGFDGYYSQEHFAKQREIFNIHAEVAVKNNLPIIIHTRSATEQTLDALSYYVKNHGLQGVIHCFTGDKSLATKYLDLGFLLSFSGVLTYKNALDVQEVARFAPVNMILVETDAPYLTPVPLRSKDSKINKPAYVKYTFEFLSSLRKEPILELQQALEENFYKLFPKAKLIMQNN